MGGARRGGGLGAAAGGWGLQLQLLEVLHRLWRPSPVLILTGHFSWHMPSAAQVCSPSYS